MALLETGTQKILSRSKPWNQWAIKLYRSQLHLSRSNICYVLVILTVQYGSLPTWGCQFSKLCSRLIIVFVFIWFVSSSSYFDETSTVALSISGIHTSTQRVLHLKFFCLFDFFPVPLLLVGTSKRSKDNCR